MIVRVIDRPIPLSRAVFDSAVAGGPVALICEGRVIQLHSIIMEVRALASFVNASVLAF
jgi:hypothetical protein